jgi:excisionase family DNA binding protein
MEVITNGYEIKRLYKVHEVAEILNVSRSQVYRLISLGQIPCIRIGQATRIHPNDLCEYIKIRKGRKGSELK